ncbi:MAG TPA: AI-2E family transporter [Planctomycetota bacterium]|jgi:predicted PurR-regulated permease PerM|nr:AI-2E family transporter [Planctomycetota bacterium]
MTRGWKIAFLAVLAIGAIGLAYYLRAVFLPLLVALLLSYVLNPVLGWLERRKVPRKASIAGVYLLLLGAMAFVALVAVPGAFGQATDFIRDTFLGENPKINRLIAKAEPMLVRTAGPERAQEIIKLARERVAELTHELPQVSGRIFSEVLSFLTGGIATLFSMLSFLILVPVYLFFLLKNLNPWWERLTHYIPRAYRGQTLSTLGRIHRANMSFFRGQITISLLEGLIIFVGLSLIHVGYPLLFGLLYTVASVIPFLGVITMFAGVELFVLADTGQFGTTFWMVAGLFGLIQALEALVFQPLILGKETGLHPMVIILALLSAGQLLGLFGVLLAIPLASTLKILFEDYVRPMFEEVADLTRVRRRPEDPEGPPLSP